MGIAGGEAEEREKKQDSGWVSEKKHIGWLEAFATSERFCVRDGWLTLNRMPMPRFMNGLVKSITDSRA